MWNCDSFMRSINQWPRVVVVLVPLCKVRVERVYLLDAVFADQVYDEFRLMDAFEISHLRRITRLDQGGQIVLHEVDYATAEHVLFVKEIIIGFLLERSPEHSDAGQALGLCDCEDDFLLLVARFLPDDDEVRHTGFFDEALALFRF